MVQAEVCKLKGSTIKKIIFSRPENPDFAATLNKRVYAYFKENGISRHANAEMIFKTIFMFALYLVPLSLVITGVVSSIGGLFAMFIISGLGMAGIGMGIMHDAIHGSYSKNKTVNKLLSYSINLIGGSHKTWELQHNVLHHTFTNIEESDDDIHTPFFLRFSPHAPKNPIHKYQHLYTWFFYGLATLSWVTTKDFVNYTRYYKMGLVKSKKAYRIGLLQIALWKLTYYAIAMALPIIFSPFAAGMIVLAFLVKHFVTGISISMVFQTAHVMPETEFPLPDENGKIESERLIHQMVTTSNYSLNNRFLSWLVGGLNYQVEHHLFPNICHVHYRKLYPIVQQTAKEFGVPYLYKKSFGAALVSHYHMLKYLGTADAPKTAKAA